MQTINRRLDKELKLKIKEIEEKDYLSINKYIKNKNLIKEINKKEIMRINQIIDLEEGKIKSLSKLKREFNMSDKYNFNKYLKLVNELCSIIQGAIHPLTLYLVGKKLKEEKNEEIKEKLINEDKENEYWVFTNGSCNKEDMRKKNKKRKK